MDAVWKLVWKLPAVVQNELGMEESEKIPERHCEVQYAMRRDMSVIMRTFLNYSSSGAAA
jgi:hypothetical protein